MDNFKLEQDIMSCWNITNDLDHLYGYLLEELGDDRSANIVLGLMELYNIKFDSCFKTFQQFVREYYVMKKQLDPVSVEQKKDRDLYRENMFNNMSARFNRVEVIDKHGRQYIGTPLNKVEMSIQDDGKTLKIFVDY